MTTSMNNLNLAEVQPLFHTQLKIALVVVELKVATQRISGCNGAVADTTKFPNENQNVNTVKSNKQNMIKSIAKK